MILEIKQFAQSKKIKTVYLIIFVLAVLALVFSAGIFVGQAIKQHEKGKATGMKQSEQKKMIENMTNAEIMVETAIVNANCL